MSNQLTKNATAIARGKRVRFLRSKIATMTGEEFAKCCGVQARGTITNWEVGKGKIGLTEKGAKQIVQGMQNIGIDCSVVWLLHGWGKTPNVFDPNKLGRFHYNPMTANDLEYVNELGVHEVENFWEEIDLFKKRYPSHLLHTVKDDSMSPIYYRHDYVGGPRLMPHQFELVHKNICIVLFHSNQLLVRRVQFEKTDPTVMSFYIINPDKIVEYPPILKMPVEYILALAPVTRLWRNYKESSNEFYV